MAEDIGGAVRGGLADLAKLACGLLLIAVVVLRSNAARGQDISGQAASSDNGLQEIVVTAQRRSESLQTVPVAISAISSEDLDKRGITGLGDLTGGVIPSLRTEPFAGNQSILVVSMRGVASSRVQDVTFDSPVPIYIDDIYYGRAFSLVSDLNDLDRVEVLRGPQGTLFGKNSVGGAVRMVSKEPTGEFDGRVTAEGGNFGYWKVLAHVDLPAFGKLAGKVDLLATNDNGWQTNPDSSQNNFGRTEAGGGKISLRYDALDNLRFDYAYDFMEIKTTEVFNQLLSATDPYMLALGTPTAGRDDTIPFPTDRPLDNQRFWGHRFNINWDLSDSVTARSITAYRKDWAFLNNGPAVYGSLPGFFVGSTVPFITGPVAIYDQQHNQLSEELQLLGKQGAFEWVTGFFYIKENAEQSENTFYSTGYPDAVLGPAPGFIPVSVGPPEALNPPYYLPQAISPTIGAKVSSRGIAGYAQGTWKPEALDSKFALTAGVRVSNDLKTGERPFGAVYPSAYAETPSQLCSAAVPCLAPDIKDTRVPVTGIAAYSWTSELMTYFKYSTAYQAGAYGVDSRTFGGVRPSTIKTYELGQKQQFFDNKLRVNLAVYYENWQDVQLSVETVAASISEYYNGPPIKGEGLESDITYAPNRDLSINLGINYTDLHTSPTANPYPAPGGIAGGVPVYGNVLQSPRWTGSASLLDTLARTPYGNWQGDLDITATSHYFAVPQVSVPTSSYTLVNARFGLADIDLNGAKLNVTAWVKNLANKQYTTYVFAAPGTAPGTYGVFSPYGQPRTFGVQATMKF